MSLSTRTRNEAYRQIHEDGTAERTADIILNAYKQAGDEGLTRRECMLKLRDDYDYEINVITGRTNELIQDKLLVETELTRINPKSGKPNAVLVAKEYYDYQQHCKLNKPRQMSLL